MESKEKKEFKGQLYRFLINEGIIKYDIPAKDEEEEIKRFDECISNFETIQKKLEENSAYRKAIKSFFYDKYISKPKNLAIEYLYEKQKEYFSQPNNTVNLIYPETENDKQLRNKFIDEIVRKHEDEFATIIIQQKASLDIWLDFLLSSESNIFSLPIKLWILQGVLNIEDVNDKHFGVSFRNEKTSLPFVKFDLEVLKKCVSVIEEAFENSDENLELIESLSLGNTFPHLYGKIIGGRELSTKSLPKGKWVKYNQETEDEIEKKILNNEVPEHLHLFNSLHKYFEKRISKWNAAHSLDFAKDELLKGDCYIYYSADENGDFTVPRLSISMCGNNVAKVLGNDTDCNVEPCLEGVLESKLRELPSSPLQMQRLNSCKRLTQIYTKYINCEELSDNDLRFLYEIDSPILRFGFSKDERINTILEYRDRKHDLERILACNEDEILLDNEELLNQYKNSDYDFKNSIKYYAGQSIDYCYLPKGVSLRLPEICKCDLTIYKKRMKSITPPNVLNGSIFLGYHHTLEGLNLPKKVNGSIDDLFTYSIENSNFPIFLNGRLSLYSANSINNVSLPDIIYGDLELNNLKQIENVKFPKFIGGNLILTNLSYGNGMDLSNTEIVGVLYLNSLNSLEGVILPKSVGMIYIYGRYNTLEEVQAMQRDELNEKLVKTLNKVKEKSFN